MGIEAAIIGSTVVGGIMGSSASKSSAKSQSQASQAAADAQVKATEKAAAAQLEASHIAAGATTEAARMAAEATMEAARLQGISVDKAIEAQERALAEARARNAPYEQAGKEALATLQQMLDDGPGEFTESPGYQFRLDQGNKNILANASATGGLASGRTLKALQDYGQDYASYEYDKFINRYYQSLVPYQGLVSVGQNAAALSGNQGMAAANNISNLYGQLGSAQLATGANLANIYSNQGAQLAGIHTNMGNSLANSYLNSGNAQANNFMNQGNIAAQSSINQANAWTGAINNGLTGLGYYYGQVGFPGQNASAGVAASAPAATSLSPYAQNLFSIPF